MQGDSGIVAPEIRTERPFRRHARMLFSVPVHLRHLIEGGIRSRHGISLDISESGLGALIEGGLQVGDTVQIEIKLPRSGLTAICVVRHSSSVRSGFEFIGLTPEERASISQMVATA